jgi:signal transduction histidine kinase
MRTLFIVAFIFCWIPAISQDYSYSIRNYKAIDGLPQSQVNVMLEDRNGYLWIGTHGGGLARFDGREFKVYTTLDGLSSNIVHYLKLDENENLWIAHPRGITKFDGITFKKFVQPGTPATARRIRRIFEVGDTLFFTSGMGEIGKIFRDSVYSWGKSIGEKLFVRYLHLTPEKHMMMYLDDSTFYVKTETGDFTLDHKPVFNRLYGMFNYQRKVWLRTDSGYFTVDLTSKKFANATFPIKNHVVFYDTINNQFWTRYEDYLLKEQIVDNTIKTDTAIKDLDVTQVLVDSEGNTWFATTSGAGLIKYFIQDFDRCSSENMKGVMAIHQDRRGASWVGSYTRGLWRIHKGKITAYSERETYRNKICAIAESPSGEIWVGTAYGLGRYDEQKDKFNWYSREDGLSNTNIVSLEFDDQGGLWIGTYSGGVNYYDGKSFKTITERDGLISNTVNTLHYSERYNKLFIGNEFGVTTLDQRSKLTTLSIAGLENTAVASISAYQDSLILIGSGGAGISVYNPTTGGNKVITTHHGLASDFIYFIAPDDQNYIWIGSEKGITRIRLNDQLEVVENLHYDYDNGLAGVETNRNAYFLAPDTKYFGLIDGLYQFNDLKREQRKSFGLHLTDVQILFGEHSAREYADSLIGFFKIPYEPHLPPDKNHITFHFNRVDKRYPKSVKFRYFLENFDKAWSQPSSNNQVTYSNLPPGKYVFRLAATNNEGSWSPAETYAFTVLTPFYQTASFIVGMFILFAGAVTLILYLRVKQRVNQVMMLERIRVKEQETLRKEIARDFHDEMGNQLTRIINYVSLLKLSGNGNGNGNGQGHDLYTKVEDSAKYLYTGTRDFIWSIDPGNDELSKLFLHIRDFGEKLFEEKSINFRAFNAVKEKAKLPYGFSREANLIFKEAMTNAFKYSQANNVTLSLERKDGGYEMVFEDDGVGFYTGDIQKSNGLKNIRERADRIHAVLRIQSTKNQGTKIVLNFTLNKTLKYGLAL